MMAPLLSRCVTLPRSRGGQHAFPTRLQDPGETNLLNQLSLGDRLALFMFSSRSANAISLAPLPWRGDFNGLAYPGGVSRCHGHSGRHRRLWRRTAVSGTPRQEQRFADAVAAAFPVGGFLLAACKPAADSRAVEVVTTDNERQGRDHENCDTRPRRRIGDGVQALIS